MPEAVAAPVATEAAAPVAEGASAVETVATPAAPDPLAKARAVASKRIAEQNARRQEQQTLTATAQQLQAERQQRAQLQQHVESLTKKIEELGTDPVERWIKQGKTPDQVRAELEKLGDPTIREIAELRKELEATKAAQEAEKRAEADRKARAELVAHSKKNEEIFLAVLDKAPDTFPFLVDIPPRHLVAMGYDLLTEAAEEKVRLGDRRPFEEIRRDHYDDDVILLALNRRISDRAAARKAKASPAEQAATSVAPGTTPGKKPVATASPRLTNKTAPPVNLDEVDFDSLSEKEQFRLMAADITRRGGIKKKAK